MQHPIIRNSVIDRVRLVDTPPAIENFADAAHSSTTGESLSAAERLLKNAPSVTSERPE